jgi:hypothetical protein
VESYQGRTSSSVDSGAGGNWRGRTDEGRSGWLQGWSEHQHQLQHQLQHNVRCELCVITLFETFELDQNDPERLSGYGASTCNLSYKLGDRRLHVA